MASLTASPARQVSVTCDGAGPRDALCAALAETLAAASPPWEVAQAAETQLTLTVLSATKQGLRARLAWHSPTAQGETPEMGMNVTDSALSATLFPGFIQQMLKQADWPN